MSRVVNGLLHFNVQLLPADSLVHDIARLSPVGIRTTAWTRFLRIATIAFDQPRSGLHQLEMSRSGLHKKHKRCHDKKWSNNTIHRRSPLYRFRSGQNYTEVSGAYSRRIARAF